MFTFFIGCTVCTSRVCPCGVEREQRDDGGREMREEEGEQKIV